MKRQHPDNPDLFWCPKCRTYKVRGEFYNNKSKKDGVASQCRECRRKMDKDRVINKEKRREENKRWRTKNPQYQNGWYESHKKECAERSKRNKARYCRDSLDYYIKQRLKRTGVPVTPETIDLKREQLMIFRELKQIKKEVYNGTTGKGNTGTQESEKGLPDKED